MRIGQGVTTGITRHAVRARRKLALAVSVVLVGTMLQGALAPPALADDMPKIPSSEKPLSGHGVKMTPRKTDGAPRLPKHAPKHSWANPGSATVNIPRAGTHQSIVSAGHLPVKLGTPVHAKASGHKARKPHPTPPPLTGKVDVHVYGQKTARRAGVDGMLFSITPQTGAEGNAVGVHVDYAEAARTFGGAYAARLHLVRLPDCAVSSPAKKGCTAAEAVSSQNDEVKHTLTASSVTLAGTEAGTAQPMLLAATTGTSSDHGDYSASPLAASATWQTSLNTGDFAWSYDMPVPEVPGSLTPKVGLSYNSAMVDGRTSNTNNQASWVGDGFDLWPGSIERKYKACGDEGVENSDGIKVGDLCWGYDNATISFNGHAGELIPTGTDSWKIKGDDGAKVDRIYGSATNVRANGAHNDEYWRVTTTDGTRYYFGYNRLPGWSTGNEETDSTWSVPVFGNDSGEPCHGTTFTDSWCQQGYRWNLDYAVDTHGNAISYYYNTETNNYGRDLKASDHTQYDRGGYLDRVEYGLTSSAVYSAKPLAKVDFTSAERCLPQSGVTCDASTIDDKSFYWYDTPWDLNCKDATDCTTSLSPSFWTRKRLTAVTTEVLKSDGTYTPVDSWQLDHKWGMSDIDYQLLLASIQHTGKSASPEVTLPKVTFGYDQRANRLDIPGDDTAPFIKERLSTVADESGGQIDVNYSTAACDAANLPTPETNTTRCFPQYRTKQGDTDPTRQWFNKYVVDSVTQTDRTNSAPDMVTRYSYLDGAAWHFDDDDGLTKEKYKTWSTYRGYAHVRVQTGGQDPVGMKSQTDHYFLRGMDGDKASPSGGTKTVSVPDEIGGTITDHDSAAGYEYKSETYSGPGGNVLGKSISTPWHHETASRTRSWGTTTANLTGTLHTYTWTSLDNGAGSKWRQTYISYSHENLAGRVTLTNDAGDTSTAADNQCTRTTYVDNSTNWILDAVARTETVAVACSATPDRSKNVIADTRTAYDGQAYGTAPTKDDATRIATLKSHDGTTATYLESATAYDGYGRQTSTTALSGTVTATETSAPVRTDRTDGRTSTTTYSPATGFPDTNTVTTPPATAGNSATAQTTITTYDRLRGLPTKVVDSNLKRTDQTYDALGRNLKVWLPNRSQDNRDTPSYEFSYTTADGQPVAVGTTTLAGIGRHTSYTIYDGFLRPRQSQTPGPDGGRLISDTFYDERGLTAKTFAAYYNTSPPSTSLLKLDDATAVETQTWNTYDGLGRTSRTQQVAGNGDGGQVLATTTTTYGGDRTTVTPPQGATPTTTLVDARGRTTERWQYHDATLTGTPDKTLYGYDPAGRLTTLTDPAGNTWTYTYDQLGNQISAKDPDKGSTTSLYNDLNQLVSTSDARNKKITHVYDGLGRETETHEGEATGPLLTKHVWDPANFKGQLASATRYIGGSGGDAYTTSYQLYDTLYRPHRTTTTIPAAEGALAGSYQANIQYNADGTVQSTSYPAAGALASEVLTPTYDDVLRPKTLTGDGGRTYITDTAYSYTGKPLQLTYQAAGAKKTQVTNTYQWGTQRLSNSRVDRENVPGTDKSATYSYDQAGNITGIADVSRDGTDNQCFQYDYLARLTEAWAQNTTTCATSPSASQLGGPAPYWQTYSYDAVGNRTGETDHDTSGVTSKDTKHTYTYPPPKTTRPHALTQLQTTGPNGTSVDSYTYDDAGNTETRTIAGDKQTLVWDSEGHLATVTAPDGSGGTKTTTYLYDADGNRLITRTDTGTILDLGATEITLAKGSTTPKATRYYDLGGGNQAVRTNDDKLTFLIGDHHGTSELAVSSTDLTMQQRRSTPFGAARGKAPSSWPGTQGFVGGTQDASTGLTHLGARDYDPSTGRFASVDPLMDPTAPQSTNGYSYSNNNPATLSDPSGLRPDGICGGNSSSCVPSDSTSGASVHYNESWIYKGSGWLWQTYVEGRHGKRYYTRAGVNYGHTTWFVPGKPTWRDWIDIVSTVTTAYFVADAFHLVDDTVHGDYESAAWDALALAFDAPRGLFHAAEPKPRTGHEPEGHAPAGDGPSCTNSFKADTPVLLVHGKTKPISKIKPGDRVESADPGNGKHQGPRTVTAQLVHHDRDLVNVTIRHSNGHTAVLHTTSHHPFWDATLHAWVQAGNLTAGHALTTATDRHIRIVNVHALTGAADMYNLTVADLHTYYVIAGSTAVLVHNSLPCRAAMEDGLSRAHQAASSFENPGGMSGHAILDDGTRFDLSSGGDGRNLRPDHAAPPGTTAENFHHLENQTAAIMRRSGQNATLYITGTYGACPYCLPAMREMLPEGGRLLLIWRSEDGAIRNRMFIGGADN